MSDINEYISSSSQEPSKSSSNGKVGQPNKFKPYNLNDFEDDAIEFQKDYIPGAKSANILACFFNSSSLACFLVLAALKPTIVIIIPSIIITASNSIKVKPLFFFIIYPSFFACYNLSLKVI